MNTFKDLTIRGNVNQSDNTITYDHLLHSDVIQNDDLLEVILCVIKEDLSKLDSAKTKYTLHASDSDTIPYIRLDTNHMILPGQYDSTLVEVLKEKELIENGLICTYYLDEHLSTEGNTHFFVICKDEQTHSCYVCERDLVEEIFDNVGTLYKVLS